MEKQNKSCVKYKLTNKYVTEKRSLKTKIKNFVLYLFIVINGVSLYYYITLYS